jgi:uncharacterized membrane protein YqjE
MDSQEYREERAGPGIFESGRALLATLVQLMHTRVELFTTELEEEMHRIAMLLLWGAVAIFGGWLFVLMLSLTLVIAYWDEHRLLVAGVMTAVFLVLVLFSLWRLRVGLSSRPRLLASSREELRRDRDALDGRDSELRG